MRLKPQALALESEDLTGLWMSGCEGFGTRASGVLSALTGCLWSEHGHAGRLAAGSRPQECTPRQGLFTAPLPLSPPLFLCPFSSGSSCFGQRSCLTLELWASIAFG